VTSIGLGRRLREQVLDRLIDDLFQFSVERVGDEADGPVRKSDEVVLTATKCVSSTGPLGRARGLRLFPMSK
jgi:hypothetical protein